MIVIIQDEGLIVESTDVRRIDNCPLKPSQLGFGGIPVKPSYIRDEHRHEYTLVPGIVNDLPNRIVQTNYHNTSPSVTRRTKCSSLYT